MLHEVARFAPTEPAGGGHRRVRWPRSRPAPGRPAALAATLARGGFTRGASGGVGARRPADRRLSRPALRVGRCARPRPRSRRTPRAHADSTRRRASAEDRVRLARARWWPNVAASSSPTGWPTCGAASGGGDQGLGPGTRGSGLGTGLVDVRVRIAAHRRAMLELLSRKLRSARRAPTHPEPRAPDPEPRPQGPSASPSVAATTTCARLNSRVADRRRRRRCAGVR